MTSTVLIQLQLAGLSRVGNTSNTVNKLGKQTCKGELLQLAGQTVMVTPRSVRLILGAIRVELELKRNAASREVLQLF
jgi:hypothetical protein